MMLELLKNNVATNPNKKVLTLDDFENRHFQRDYSNYLLGEVKDHLSFYYGQEHYEIFLKFFEFLYGKDKFTYAAYIEAYSKLKAHIASVLAEPPKFMVTANDFLQFLFDLNVICYIEPTEDNKTFIHWCFRDRSYANISPKVKTDAEYQIFYGLAKALNVGKSFK